MRVRVLISTCLAHLPSTGRGAAYRMYKVYAARWMRLCLPIAWPPDRSPASSQEQDAGQPCTSLPSLGKENGRVRRPSTALHRALPPGHSKLRHGPADEACHSATRRHCTTHTLSLGGLSSTEHTGCLSRLYYY